MESHLPARPLSRAADPAPAPAREALDGPGSAARAEAGPGLYVHVPFCATRCGYCDFASGALSSAAVERYLRAIERELEMRAPSAAGTSFRSVFFGGGTPSALSNRHFARLLAAIRDRVAIAPQAEITLEVNPEAARDERLAAWREAGVNRLSFGVQSFHDDELRGLGRIHDAAAAARAIRRAVAHGFPRVSFDLMFAFPGHGPERWSATLDTALALAPEHVSAYAFIVEGGTPLGNTVLRGEAGIPGPDEQAELYSRLVDRMCGAGLGCYETSNFCRPGAESRHNLAYWLRRDGLAFGPSAHGLFQGFRYANHWALPRWAEALERGLLPETEREAETDACRSREIVMLALRLGTGLVLADYPEPARAALAARYGPALEAAVSQGRLERTADGFRVGPEHRFVADDVIAWIEARADRAFDTGAPARIIPSPCPSPLSPAA